jgi:Flp pilus assembly protein TadG
MTRVTARLSRFAAATGGASMVEFGLVAAFLILPLTVGLYDFATGMYRWMEVGNAARAGAAYANSHVYSTSYTTVGHTCTPSTDGGTAGDFTCAVQGATNLGAAVTVSAGAAFCGCQSGNTYTTQSITPPCSSCPNGGTTPVTLGKVTASYRYLPIFNYLGFGPQNGFNISSETTVLTF